MLTSGDATQAGVRQNLILPSATDVDPGTTLLLTNQI